MKYFVTTLFVALAVAVYAPPASAGCGQCGNEGKAHKHEAGHNHDQEAADCAACGKAKADCECKKDAGECAACGEAKADCTCKKG